MEGAGVQPGLGARLFLPGRAVGRGFGWGDPGASGCWPLALSPTSAAQRSKCTTPGPVRPVAPFPLPAAAALRGISPVAGDAGVGAPGVLRAWISEKLRVERGRISCSFTDRLGRGVGKRSSLALPWRCGGAAGRLSPASCGPSARPPATCPGLEGKREAERWETSSARGRSAGVVAGRLFLLVTAVWRDEEDCVAQLDAAGPARGPAAMRGWRVAAEGAAPGTGGWLGWTWRGPEEGREPPREGSSGPRWACRGKFPGCGAPGGVGEPARLVRAGGLGGKGRCGVGSRTRRRGRGTRRRGSPAWASTLAGTTLGQRASAPSSRRRACEKLFVWDQ